MRLFIYEWITGGGLGGRELPFSLLREGRAMVTALAEDALSAGHDVGILWDDRLPLPTFSPHSTADILRVGKKSNGAPSAHHFERAAGNADWTIVIAPETDGVLLDLAHRVQGAGCRLLGPSPEVIALGSDKHRTAAHLTEHGVPSPRGCLLQPGETLPRDFTYPAVLKPVDGCGSLGVRMIDGADAAPGSLSQPHRLEAFLPGLAASVAVLCGPQGVTTLAACRQHLAGDGSFAYLGGSLPLPAGEDARAQQLARRAAACLPPTLGYLGFDLVLGAAVDGSQDAVVEINPRLTTSYVGLRRTCSQNLVAAMLAIAAGEAAALTFSPSPVEFQADGTIVS